MGLRLRSCYLHRQHWRRDSILLEPTRRSSWSRQPAEAPAARPPPREFCKPLGADRRWDVNHQHVSKRRKRRRGGELLHGGQQPVSTTRGCSQQHGSEFTCITTNYNGSGNNFQIYLRNQPSTTVYLWGAQLQAGNDPGRTSTPPVRRSRDQGCIRPLEGYHHFYTIAVAPSNPPRIWCRIPACFEPPARLP